MATINATALPNEGPDMAIANQHKQSDDASPNSNPGVGSEPQSGAGISSQNNPPISDQLVGSPMFAKLIEDAAIYAMRVYSNRPSILACINRANTLSAQYEKTGKIEQSDEAISTLQSFLEKPSNSDIDRHSLLYSLSVILCRRVEVQVSSKIVDGLLGLHLTLQRSVFALRQAINASPASFDVKVQYLGQLGHTATLWSTILSSRWDADNTLALLHYLDQEDSATDETTEKVTGFVAAVVKASTLSTAFGVTQDPEYRNRGREVYRHTLRSMREILPLEAVIDPIKSMDIFTQLGAFSFIKDGLIPFIVQIMALLMQSLIEVPLSSVVGRRAAALAIGNGLQQQGVEWLEQCLMLVWGQLKLRAPAPLEATRVKGMQADLEAKMGKVALAFLGLCIYVDIIGSEDKSIAHPEQMAYLLLEEWLKLRAEANNDPNLKNVLRPYSFSHISNAALTAPAVMLNLWGTQCDALILFGQGRMLYLRLEGVTEEFAASMQTRFREGLQADHFRSRGGELDTRGSEPVSPKSMAIHRVLAALWKEVVKPIFDKMGLKPVENAELDPPRLTWCPTGPTSFFPLHAAGLYDSKDKGTKTYEYVASSYTPTLTTLANANVALSRGEEPFKGILAVSQPDKDGQTPIPKTVEEVTALLKAVDEAQAADNTGINMQWLKGAQATKDAVLAGMESSTWVHLACHARQYPLNSSESAFMLANGETLSLADISAHASADGELAFLSACQTAAGDFDLSEEGVHLAAGMLISGYRSVIATTWSVRDEDAPVVSKAVYQKLLEGGMVNRTKTALALHHATRLLRDQVGENQFMRWAPFVHLGV